jgi:hypothetical protein
MEARTREVLSPVRLHVNTDVVDDGLIDGAIASRLLHL